MSANALSPDVATAREQQAPAPTRTTGKVVLTADVTQKRRLRLGVPSLIRRAVVPLLLLGLWELGSTHGWWPAAVLPSPVTVNKTFWTLIQNGQLPSNLLVSLQRVAVGASIGIAVGTLLGLTSGLWQLAEEALDSTLQMMRTLPYLVMLPLFVIWFGVDELPKILIIVIGTSLPMYLNTFSGVRSVDPRLTEMASTFGLNRVRLIVSVIIPAAMPAILTGLRYSLGISWLSLVVAEQINARSGLGLLISNAESLFLTSVLVVCVLVYAILGLTTDLLVRILEKRLLAWRGRSVSW
ncbi:MAG TPA: ABC transporter permease [Gaiellaceae bacterium]|nr:ABC transporter permease [Gaiellaceae bacterium]